MTHNPYFLKPVAEKTCSRCLFDDTIAEINQDGVCEYCQLHDSIEASSVDFEAIRKKIQNTKGKYNCLIGISGGADSATLLYAAVVYWGLKPLVIHFDNHYNVPAAKKNMKRLIKKLNVDAITYMVNREEYENICKAFLAFGLPDADAANDLAMSKLMYETSRQYKIKWILNGHHYKMEGSTPKPWTRLDGKYLADVYQEYTGKRLINYPNLSFWDQIKYALLGIKQVRPFHYKDVAYDYIRKEMEGEIGFESYGAKHQENRYTDFIGTYLLPSKFGIDKRIVYLSAEVRSGITSREEARTKLATPAVFDIRKIPSRFTDLIGSNIGDRNEYEQYNFRKWKWVIWLMWKVGVVPITFYKKYAN